MRPGGRVESKIGSHHTDHGVMLFVDIHCAPDDAAVRSEASLPKAVTQNDHMIVAGLIFLRQESPSKYRLHPQELEDLRRGYYPKQRLGMIAAFDADHPGSRGGHF